MELNSLPFDCLLLLLDLFPVKEQVKFRAVCTNWNEIVERLWRSVKIISIDYVSAENKYDIRFDNNSKVSCSVGYGLERFVTREHFPGVLRLNLNFSMDEKCANNLLLSHCLTQWTATLITLKFYLPPANSHEYQSNIWTQIDSLKSLRLLWLHSNISFVSAKMRGKYRIPPSHLRIEEEVVEENFAWKVPVNLSILANLKTFILNDYYTAWSNWINGIDTKGNDEIGGLTQLGHNLERLSLQTLTSASIQSFMSIAPKLTSLLKLYLNIPQFTQPYLLDLLNSLAQLKQLNDLCFDDIHWDQFISLSTHHEYPKLTSVKYLNMEFDNKSKPTNPRQHMDQFNQLFVTCIPIMFPSLTKIDVKMYGLEDQPFVDMIESKMKRKFVALSDIKFSLIAYDNVINENENNILE